MSKIHLGDTVPDFEQDSSIGPIRFHEWAGNSWVVLFSHPADFTPVCTTELGLTGKLQGEFEKRNVKAIALSVDDADSHRAWTKDRSEEHTSELQSIMRISYAVLRLTIKKHIILWI